MPTWRTGGFRMWVSVSKPLICSMPWTPFSVDSTFSHPADHTSVHLPPCCYSIITKIFTSDSSDVPQIKTSLIFLEITTLPSFILLQHPAIWNSFWGDFFRVFCCSALPKFTHTRKTQWTFPYNITSKHSQGWPSLNTTENTSLQYFPISVHSCFIFN